MKRRDFIKTTGAIAAVSLTGLDCATLFPPENPMLKFSDYKGFNLTEKAGGRGPLPKFLKTLVSNVNSNDISAAISTCDQQRGSMANIVKTGLERYQELNAKKDLNKKA